MIEELRNLDEKQTAVVEGTKLVEGQPQKPQAQRPENLLVDLVYAIPAEGLSTNKDARKNGVESTCTGGCLVPTARSCWRLRST